MQVPDTIAIDNCFTGATLPGSGRKSLRQLIAHGHIERDALSMPRFAHYPYDAVEQHQAFKL